jgi:hypothetical protein
MFEMDKEIVEILESYGISLDVRMNQMLLRSVIVDCPKCGGKFRVAFDPVKVEKRFSDTGIVNIEFDLPCSHSFIGYIDREFKVRGLVEFEKYIVASAERIDIRFMKEQEKALEQLHSKLLDEGTPEMQYRVFTELARLRKAMNSIK